MIIIVTPNASSKMISSWVKLTVVVVVVVLRIKNKRERERIVFHWRKQRLRD